MKKLVYSGDESYQYCACGKIGRKVLNGKIVCKKSCNYKS